MRFISLFAGCGGLDLGLAEAGFQLVLANEASKGAAAVLRTVPEADLGEWNGARDRLKGGEVVTGDVHDLLNSERLREYQGIDLVCGGPPCQGFSVAGYMDPDDERSQLVFRFMDAVGQARPRAFIMENVAALAGSRWKLVLDRLRRQAGGLGYKSWVAVANARSHGVPQDRERMFLVGLRPGLAAPRLPARQEPPGALAALRAVHAAPAGPDSVPNARITLARNPVLRQSPYAGMLLNGGGRVIDLRRPAPTLPATMGGNRTPVIDLGQLEDDAAPWIEGYHADLMAGEPPLARLPASARMRRLSLREAAALSAFPPHYPFSGSATQQFRQVGNAVPPPLARAVGEAVARSLGGATLEPW